MMSHASYRQGSRNCPDCGRAMPVQILVSGAGWYIGRTCERCGPWDRISSRYWGSRREAEAALAEGDFDDRANAVENEGLIGDD